jgi:hypothetical protein
MILNEGLKSFFVGTFWNLGPGFGVGASMWACMTSLVIYTWWGGACEFCEFGFVNFVNLVLGSWFRVWNVVRDAELDCCVAVQWFRVGWLQLAPCGVNGSATTIAFGVGELLGVMMSFFRLKTWVISTSTFPFCQKGLVKGKGNASKGYLRSHGSSGRIVCALCKEEFLLKKLAMLYVCTEPPLISVSSLLWPLSTLDVISVSAILHSQKKQAKQGIHVMTEAKQALATGLKFGLNCKLVIALCRGE